MIILSQNHITERMFNSSSLNKEPLRYHVVFWTGYFLFNFVRWGSYFGDYTYSFQSNLVEFAIHILICYFNLYFLLPKLAPKHLKKYLLFLLLAVFAVSLLRIVLTYELVTTDIWRESGRDPASPFDFNYVLAVYTGELYVVGLTTAIKLIIDWIRAQRANQELEKQNLETELAYLKFQVQPHFFFNTLNNLYSLTLDKSDQAPETVMKLSELMHYVIYEAKNKSVSLIKEIEHIQHYIDLERLRFGDKLDVNLQVEGNIEEKLLPPLLLIPFVENSFKHGARSPDNTLPIDIHLLVKENRLFFSITNRTSPASFSNKNLKENQSGIGVENTQRRLNLLFPGDYLLSIYNEDHCYTVNLNFPVYENKMSYH
ncbi:MAG: histidine kinase [Cytophagales bacterium]|nr:histidine kinase [Cytophagales bacterium]